MDSAQICDCGHTHRAHINASCEVCACNRYAPASPAQAVILAAIQERP